MHLPRVAPGPPLVSHRDGHALRAFLGTVRYGLSQGADEDILPRSRLAWRPGLRGEIDAVADPAEVPFGDPGSPGFDRPSYALSAASDTRVHLCGQSDDRLLTSIECLTLLDRGPAPLFLKSATDDRGDGHAG
jgi:hypothetical protein